MDNDQNLPKLSKASSNADGSPAYAVMLPCAPENFADFILGLLGESQIVESRIRGLFVVGRNEIQNITNIISQRVSQQNESSLLSWSLTVTYDDGTNVKHSSLQEFVEYAEIKEHIATSFTLRMSYLIKFQERKTFEKQSVDVTFISGYTGDYDKYIEYPYNRKRANVGFHVRIEHTLRSWGVDMESLLQNRLQAFRRLKEKPIKKFLNNYSTYVQTTLSLGFFTLSMVGLVLQTQKNAAIQASELNRRLTSYPEAEKVVEGIKITVQQVTSGAIQKNVIISLIFVLLFGIFAIVIAATADSALSLQRTGVLMLTPQAEEYLEKSEKPFFPYTRQILTTVFLSVAAGVIANYLFAWLIRN